VSGPGGTAAIVLAGGAARRFGGDKLAAEVRGRPLLHSALLACDAVATTLVLVLAPGAPTPALPPLRSPLLVAHDGAAHEGPLAGLAAGLAVLPPGTERALLVGGDMPGLLPAVLGLLLAPFDSDPTLGVAVLESDPVAVLPMGLRPQAAGAAVGALLAEGRRSLRALLDRVPAAVVAARLWRGLDPAGETLRDVDTRDDLPGDDLPGP